MWRRYPGKKNEASQLVQKVAGGVGVGQGLDESILQGGGVPLSDIAGRVALSEH